ESGAIGEALIGAPVHPAPAVRGAKAQPPAVPGLQDGQVQAGGLGGHGLERHGLQDAHRSQTQQKGPAIQRKPYRGTRSIRDEDGRFFHANSWAAWVKRPRRPSADAPGPKEKTRRQQPFKPFLEQISIAKRSA